MKIRPSLSSKILLLAFLNVILLAVVIFFFVHSQVGFDLSSFLFAPARDRILSSSRLLALEFAQEPPEKWGDSLARHAKTSGAEIFFFSSAGNELAGPQVALPQSVRDHLLRGRRHAHPDERMHMPPALGPPPLFLVHSPEQGYWVGVPVPIFNGHDPESGHGAVIWRFPSLWSNTFFFDYRPWLAVILAIILISVACWLPLIRGLTRTIGQMTRATAQVAEGRFEIALPAKRNDELGQLSLSINRMAQRLSDLLQGQRRFLSDIAHELCSPVARMQVALGILQERAGEDPAGYVNDVAEEATHMSDLINELLSFSKAQSGSPKASLTRVNVAEVARRVVEREAAQQSTVKTQIDPQLEVIAQPEYLYRSLANLVRNAVRYASGAGPIVVSANNGGTTVTIRVSDNGPGLPDCELENVFKPFYRPEFARQRETGGVGLGLAIVKSCIEACGGVVSCRNRKPHGLEVELTLAAAEARRA